MHGLDPPYAHNDVKPGNVLITHRKGQPPLAILMDFGSARPARKQIRSRSEALQLQVLFSSYTPTQHTCTHAHLCSRVAHIHECILNFYAVISTMSYHF